MKDEILERLRELPGKIGFYYKNLTTGETISYHAEEPMMAASVIKLFILAEAQREIADGRLDKDRLVCVRRENCVPSCGALTYLHDGINVTVEDLYTLMIILSDNTATNYMIDILGFEAVNDLIRSLGYKTTALNRKMFDLEKSKRGIQNTICAAEVGDLLDKMYRGKLVSREASADMLRIMKDQGSTTRYPSSWMRRWILPTKRGRMTE